MPVMSVWCVSHRNAFCDEDGPGGQFMCPACDHRCNYTKLSESCIFARLVHVFDNKATIAMAVFMSAWGEYDWILHLLTMLVQLVRRIVATVSKALSRHFFRK